MPRTLGREKSTLPRGHKNTRKAEYGVCGNWMVVAKWKWDEHNDVFTCCMDDGEKLHVLFVYTYEIKAVMEAIGGVYSHSKHLGERLLAEAVFKNGKPRLWIHGLVRPDVLEKQIVGVTEEQAPRLAKSASPWNKSGGNKDEVVQTTPVKNPIVATKFRL